jgi:hypothetical protein
LVSAGHALRLGRDNILNCGTHSNADAVSDRDDHAESNQHSHANSHPHGQTHADPYGHTSCKAEAERDASQEL